MRRVLPERSRWDQLSSPRALLRRSLEASPGRLRPAVIRDPPCLRPPHRREPAAARTAAAAVAAPPPRVTIPLPAASVRGWQADLTLPYEVRRS